MVEVQVTNEKLRDRALRIVAEATGRDRESARAALDGSGGELKTAIVSLAAGVVPAAARARLDAVGGSIRRALNGFT